MSAELYQGSYKRSFFSSATTVQMTLHCRFINNVTCYGVTIPKPNNHIMSPPHRLPGNSYTPYALHPPASRARYDLPYEIFPTADAQNPFPRAFYTCTHHTLSPAATISRHESPFEKLPTTAAPNLLHRSSYSPHHACYSSKPIQHDSLLELLLMELVTHLTTYLDPLAQINLKNVSSRFWRRIRFPFRDLPMLQMLDISPFLPISSDPISTLLERLQIRFIAYMAQECSFFAKAVDELVREEESLQDYLREMRLTEDDIDPLDPDVFHAFMTAQLRELWILRERVSHMNKYLIYRWALFRLDGCMEPVWGSGPDGAVTMGGYGAIYGAIVQLHT